MMMKKISCCWVWPCSVLYAIAMWPGAGHAFVANGAARSPSDHKAGAAKPGSAGVRPLIMGGGKRCNLDMHWDQVPFFSVEPAASDYLFWRMVGMGADRDDAVRGEPGVEADTDDLVEMAKTIDARQKDKKKSGKEAREAMEKIWIHMVNTRKTTDRGGLPPNGQEGNDGEGPGSDGFPSGIDANVTSDGVTLDMSDNMEGIVGSFDSTSLEESGVSVGMASTQQQGTTTLITTESTRDTVLTIGAGTDRDASIQKGAAKMVRDVLLRTVLTIGAGTDRDASIQKEAAKMVRDVLLRTVLKIQFGAGTDRDASIQKESAKMVRDVLLRTVLKIGAGTDRDASIQKEAGKTAMGGIKKSGDTPTRSEVSNKRAGQKRADRGPLKWWGGVR